VFASLISPYTTLVLQVAAIVAAAAVLVLFAPGVARRVAVPIVAALLLIIVAVQIVWSASGTFDAVRLSLANTAGVGDREVCMVEGSHPDLVPFARWISERTPPDAKIAYVTRSFDRPCFQFALLPRRMTSDRGSADYVMYLDPIDDASQRYLAAQRKRSPGKRDVEFFSDTWALERLD
jgi:hypothetical protein